MTIKLQRKFIAPNPAAKNFKAKVYYIQSSIKRIKKCNAFLLQRSLVLETY